MTATACASSAPAIACGRSRVAAMTGLGRLTWREVASHGDPRELKRAEAALARYGRLIDLPDHPIVTAKQARGREADIVIVVRFSGISDDDLATTMSRARRKLIVVSGQQTP
jgi:hypothetical protein